MGGTSTVGSIFAIIIIGIIFKQYLTFWIVLDRMGLRSLKYILPICEIGLLIFFEDLFLFPSVTFFLILIYNGKIYNDKVYTLYYNIKRRKFAVNRKNIFYAFLLSPILILSVDIIYGEIFKLFQSFNVNITLSGEIITRNCKSFVDYLMIFGVVCIIAPIVEEFTFRVIIYDNWLVKTLNKRIFAVIISSIIFAFSHFNYTIYLYTFITGVILCFVYDILGFLSATIVHMLFNIHAFFGFMGIIIDGKFFNTMSVMFLIAVIGFHKMHQQNVR